MFILRFDLESGYALGGEQTEVNWSKWIDEAVAAVTAICRAVERHDVPATFFVVGLLLEKAGDLAALLTNLERNGRPPCLHPQAFAARRGAVPLLSSRMSKERWTGGARHAAQGTADGIRPHRGILR